MILLEQPYFLKNKEWYTINDSYNDGKGYSLTEKAPIKAIQSYNEFYELQDSLEFIDK